VVLPFLLVFLRPSCRSFTPIVGLRDLFETPEGPLCLLLCKCKTGSGLLFFTCEEDLHHLAVPLGLN